MQRACTSCQFRGEIIQVGASCKRFPPQLTSWVNGNNDTIWEQSVPWVALTDWCGEYKERVDG